MKLKFNPDLDYQQDAIESTLSVFEGLSTAGEPYRKLGIANVMALNPDKLLDNLHRVQEQNFIEKSGSLFETKDDYPFPNFSVEMETGTGKTYVYLRSIFELHKRLGLRKFIIVVPSVAIREGVLSSLAMMKEHFRSLYNNAPFDHYVYSAKDLSKVRQFATANTLQIMVINIQAFQRDAGDVDSYDSLTSEQIKKLSVIHREQDRMSGVKPIEFIQDVRPVLIIDEPQSVDNTAKARRAVNHLKPLFALRYSATHRNPHNVVYQLGPVKAYDMKLVKQISVASIQSQSNVNQTYLRLSQIGYSGKAKTPSASVVIFEDTPNGTREKAVKLKQGTDLSDHTNRPGYQGYVVDEIYAEPGAEYVRFANNVILEPDQEKDGIHDDVLKEQIRQTVEEHFKKERNLQKQGLDVKVLSLFFIDKVANYRYYDEHGNSRKGKLARWFEEAYRDLAASPLFSDLPKRNVEQVHNGYFAEVKKRGKVVELKDTSGTTASGTLMSIIRNCRRLSEFKTNPQGFITEAARQIHKALDELLVDGIRYEKLAGENYKMELFNEPELEAYLDRSYQVQYGNRGDQVQTPYDYIECDSHIERMTAQALDGADNVKFFCKLPRWFTVPTPVGDYNPDWAVVLEEDRKVYLIRETKTTHDSDKRRLEENLKILCGEAHFQALGDVDYRVAVTVAEVTAV